MGNGHATCLREVPVNAHNIQVTFSWPKFRHMSKLKYKRGLECGLLLCCLWLAENFVSIGEMENCNWGHAISTKLKKKKKI